MLDEGRLLAVPQATRKPWHAGLGNGVVLALARGRGRGGVLGPDGELGVRLRLGRRVAADRVLELAHALAQRTADLGKAAGAEEQEREQEEQDDLGGADV